MKYLQSADDDLTLRLNAHKKNMKNYVIVKKRKKLSDSRFEESYDSYELDLEELKTIINIEDETLQSFIEKYKMQPFKDNEEIISISLYDELDVIKSIGKLIKVYIFEPEKPGYVREIHDTREALESIVEGDPEYVYIGRKDLVLICNDTGMLDNLPKHRGLHGTFLIKGLEDGYSASLTDEQIHEIRNEFDKKENNSSKSKYLKEYFDTHEVSRKMFAYNLGNATYYYGTEVIIDFILQQEDESKLAMIEAEIQSIEKYNKDIYKYLESIGLSLAKQNAY